MSRTDLSGGVIFPIGERSENENFTGGAWLNILTPPDASNPTGNVTFEPGCHNHWHKHPGGQTLLVTGGRGYYQEWGKSARELHAGDVISVLSNVKHWHGAARDSWFAHLVVQGDPRKGPTTWIEILPDEEYEKLK